MYENICYKSPFLKEAIIRLDFASPFERLRKVLPEKVSKLALSRFPIFEPNRKQAKTIQFTPSSEKVETSTLESMDWMFHGRYREKTLHIMPECIIATTKNYKSYEEFILDISGVAKEILLGNEDLVVSRIGIRYINVISIDEGHPLEWGDYVDEKILGIVDFHNNDDALSRIFHIVEFNYDGLFLKHQFGIANPDYPAPIHKKEFVLDLDAWANGALQFEDVIKNIELGHEKIQDLFERSITYKTRQLMKPQ